MDDLWFSVKRKAYGLSVSGDPERVPLTLDICYNIRGEVKG
jgi:hypothetical protein